MNTQQEIELLQQKEFLLNGEPVAILTGDEFQKKEGLTLTQQVIAYYASIGNKVISPAYGDIILDKKGIDDDFAHGIGRIKAIAFAAVPAIIGKGIVILKLGNYKADEKILSAMIAAPISIANMEYVGVVVVRQNKIGDNRLYVHEVTIKEKLLEKRNQGVEKNPCKNSSNPTSSLATPQGLITKVLQNIVSTKSFSPENKTKKGRKL
ncbi:MAG: hypothetical protein LBL90_11690 [Prevotellaceae bacterium]|jgi:hypothetical protein|nr:hypothetical protein [Prevotellaceae bacterium]